MQEAEILQDGFQLCPFVRCELGVDEHGPVAELAEAETAGDDVLQLVEEEGDGLLLRRQDGEAVIEHAFFLRAAEICPEGRAGRIHGDTGGLVVELHHLSAAAHVEVEGMGLLGGDIAQALQGLAGGGDAVLPH